MMIRRIRCGKIKMQSEELCMSDCWIGKEEKNHWAHQFRIMYELRKNFVN